jgi:hypothetical protein
MARLPGGPFVRSQLCRSTSQREGFAGVLPLSLSGACLVHFHTSVTLPIRVRVGRATVRAHVAHVAPERRGRPCLCQTRAPAQAGVAPFLWPAFRKHWGETGGTPTSTIYEIRVRTGKFTFWMWLACDAPCGVFCRGYVENTGVKLAPQVGFGSEYGIDSIETCCVCCNTSNLFGQKCLVLHNRFVTCNRIIF